MFSQSEQIVSRRQPGRIPERFTFSMKVMNQQVEIEKNFQKSSGK